MFILDELRDEAAQQSLSGGRFAAQMPVFDETTRHGKGGISEAAIESCGAARAVEIIMAVVISSADLYGLWLLLLLGWARLWNVSTASLKPFVVGCDLVGCNFFAVV